MSCITLDLQIAEPVLLNLVVDPGVCIQPVQVPALEPLFLAWLASYVPPVQEEEDPLFTLWKNQMYTTGAKQTGVDAGILGQESLNDDYVYKCVVGGIAGVAVWKRSVLFQT